MLFKQLFFKYALIAFLISWTSVMCGQYCLNVGPTNDQDSNIESVTLNGVGGGINYTGCPGVVGLEDLTASQQVALDAGNSYTANVVFGSCQGNYGAKGEAWIDYNDNQQFEQNESIGTWEGMPPSGMLNFVFQVPPNAILASVRMRVMMHEGAASLPLDPCANFTWGSVVDFTVNIQNGVGCNGYFGNYPADAIEVPSYPYRDTNSTTICYSSFSQVYSSPDVFYLAVLDPSKDSLSASLCEANFDTYLTIQNTSGDVLYYNDDYAACAPQSKLCIPTAGLDSLYIVVEGWNNLVGDYILEVDNFHNSTTNTSVNFVNQKSLKPLVYPNPTNSDVYISGKMPQACKLYDINGRCLLQVNATNQLRLQSFSAGLYLLEIYVDNQIFREKVLLH